MRARGAPQRLAYLLMLMRDFSPVDVGSTGRDATPTGYALPHEQARLAKSMLENPGKTIDSVVADIFAQYPVPPAGGAAQ